MSAVRFSVAGAKRMYCPSCGSGPCAKKPTSHALHLLLSLVTCGLWLPIWLLAAMSGVYRCLQCGRRAYAARVTYWFNNLAVAFILITTGLIGWAVYHSATTPPLNKAPAGSAQPADPRTTCTSARR